MLNKEDLLDLPLYLAAQDGRNMAGADQGEL